jgi:hypothetical protein
METQFNESSFYINALAGAKKMDFPLHLNVHSEDHTYPNDPTKLNIICEKPLELIPLQCHFICATRSSPRTIYVVVGFAFIISLLHMSSVTAFKVSLTHLQEEWHNLDYRTDLANIALTAEKDHDAFLELKKKQEEEERRQQAITRWVNAIYLIRTRILVAKVMPLQSSLLISFD